MVDYLADYREKLGDRKLVPDVKPGYMRELVPSSAPEEAESWQTVFADIERCIMPGVLHLGHPNFYGFFSMGDSFPSLLADMLANMISGPGFTWASMPASTELETIVMDWLAELLGLPDYFKFSANSSGGGVLQSYASDATYYALLLARQRAFKKFINYDVSKFVMYCTSESHSSVAKAGLLAAVQVRKVSVDDMYRMRGDALQKAIEDDRSQGLIPFYVLCTLDTTTCCVFDDLAECGEVCNREGLWLHVDAAYAGSSFACDENRYLMKGIELVDSFNFNVHKWMRAAIDCSAFWVKDRQEAGNAFNVDPLYLRNPENELPEYRHWQIPLGRRFRSLKVWFILRLYGKNGIRKHIRHHISMAKEFEKMILSDDRFEVVYPVTMGLVCFRLKGSNEMNQCLHQCINAEGNIYLTPSKLGEEFILRFALIYADISSKQLNFAFQNIIKHVDKCKDVKQ